MSLTALYNVFQLLGLTKYAQETKKLSEEYDEPWHEEAVREFGSEPISEEEYAEQNIYDKSIDISTMDSYFADLLNDLLEIHNIKIISEGGKSYIGEGSYGTVYSVIYNGINCAMKVYPSDEANDGDAWNKIFERTKNAPNKFNKYLPIIYLNDERGGIEILIMEKLYRIPSNLRLIQAYENYYLSNDNIERLILKIENMTESAIPHLNMLLESFDIDKTITAEMLPHEEELRGILYDSRDKIKISNRERLLEKIINRYMRLILKNIGTINLKNESIIAEYFYSNLRSIFDSTVKFPTTYEDILQMSDENIPPGLTNYYKFLVDMYNVGIKWHDLHDDNIMVDKDDNIKIIDVGLFKFQ